MSGAFPLETAGAVPQRPQDGGAVTGTSQFRASVRWVSRATVSRFRTDAC